MLFQRRKKFIPYGKQNIKVRDIFSVLRVLKSNLITQGPEVEKYSRRAISLPIYPQLSLNDQKYVINKFLKALYMY